ncbi:hypothetical protein HYW87_01350, partial [Candidatus Roizmanbacteria bacterium]|nr:hypothetical protein [Candidatus Roizmanbacteria bacterium]
MKLLKTFLITLFILSSSIFFTRSVYADDFKNANNKFGIHLAQPHLEDLQKAKELVNSNGGDWGYVTLVIQENDRNKDKWQDVFNRLRKLHLIPIIRIATKPEGSNWKRPTKEDASSWAEFLNSLNWVIKHRYVVLFNEPNHASEWGGAVDPQNYATVAVEFAKKLTEKNSDFFVMLAGLDASAPQALPNYQDEYTFLTAVLNKITIQQYNNLFSGLASHSYPNPAFAGSPYGEGRGTVRTYLWELQVLSASGVKTLPVFITETGWDRAKIDEDSVAENFIESYRTIWLPDEKVVAVTPFVFDYQGDPFLNFSWKKFQDSDFYQQYYTVQSLAKTRGEPEQIEKGTIQFDLPKELVAHSNYHFQVGVRNNGQAVWDKDFGYQLSIVGGQDKPFEYFFSDLKNINPFEDVEIDLYIKTNATLGKRDAQIELQKDGKPLIQSATWHFEIFPLPSLRFSVSLFPYLSSNGADFEIQVFNSKEELVFKK